MAQPQDEDMADMPDADAGAENGPADMDSEEEEPVEKLIRILPGSTDTAASFEFLKEDHTLGNALRHVILKNPDVDFCGYSIPHPSEAKMHLRIQTFDEINVQDVLEKGLNDLMDLCDVVIEKFEVARDGFKEGQMAP